jgi:hypothetical protein
MVSLVPGICKDTTTFYGGCEAFYEVYFFSRRYEGIYIAYQNQYVSDASRPVRHLAAPVLWG